MSFVYRDRNMTRLQFFGELSVAIAQWLDEQKAGIEESDSDVQLEDISKIGDENLLLYRMRRVLKNERDTLEDFDKFDEWVIDANIIESDESGATEDSDDQAVPNPSNTSSEVSRATGWMYFLFFVLLVLCCVCVV